jgi:hypothetical protein
MKKFCSYAVMQLMGRSSAVMQLCSFAVVGQTYGIAGHLKIK